MTMCVLQWLGLRCYINPMRVINLPMPLLLSAAQPPQRVGFRLLLLLLLFGGWLSLAVPQVAQGEACAPLALLAEPAMPYALQAQEVVAVPPPLGVVAVG